jgi:hypothetical protein
MALNIWQPKKPQYYSATLMELSITSTSEVDSGSQDWLNTQHGPALERRAITA